MHAKMKKPQFYIQLVYKPQFGTSILLFEPFGQLSSGQKGKKKWIWFFLSNFWGWFKNIVAFTLKSCIISLNNSTGAKALKNLQNLRAQICIIHMLYFLQTLKHICMTLMHLHACKTDKALEVKTYRVEEAKFVSSCFSWPSKARPHLSLLLASKGVNW